MFVQYGLTRRTVSARAKKLKERGRAHQGLRVFLLQVVYLCLSGPHLLQQIIRSERDRARARQDPFPSIKPDVLQGQQFRLAILDVRNTARDDFGIVRDGLSCVEHRI